MSKLRSSKIILPWLLKSLQKLTKLGKSIKGCFPDRQEVSSFIVRQTANLAGQSGVTVFFELCLPAGASA
jgi:hypothetical protein